MRKGGSLMARGEPLFSKYDLSLALLEQDKRIKEAVEKIEANSFLNSSQDDLCEQLEEQFRINVPSLNEDAIQVDQQEATVDVSGDPNRMIFDRSQPFYMKGTEVTFFVPYQGDRELFFFRPNQFSLSGGRATVREGELAFSYTRLDHDAQAAKHEFDRDLTFVRSHLETQRNQVKQHNESLRSRIQAFVSERKDRLLKSQGMVAALGYPMRRRGDAPTTYIAPNVRRKPPIARPAAPTKPFRPEPALEMAEYEHILEIISNMVHVIERSPEAFKGMREEDLRQHFLVQLNGQYEGQATGETFNFQGKTDILIRAEGRNIFIAECKFWKGSESLKEAIDQLLGYASWRDTKVALLIFNRDRQLSGVLPKIPEVFKAHPNFRRQLEYRSETGFRFVLHHRDDQHRELIVTVLVFEVPA
jgi:hypothetical protein